MKNTLYRLGVLSSVCIFVLVFAGTIEPRASKPIIVPEESSIGGKDDPHARLRYEWMMLRDPATGMIPTDIRKKELEFAGTLPTREELGPSGVEGDSPNATWTSRGPYNVGGRTRALGIDRLNVNTILAGGVSGGMWRSLDGGSTWTKTTAPAALHSVTCLVQDPRSGQSTTWYAGTGELTGNSASGNGSAFYVGNGLLKSVDNGASWTVLTATSGGDPQLFDRFFDIVWNVAVHPTTGHVYAATYSALYRSTNGGTNWTAVLGEPTSQPYSDFTDVQIASNGTIYATGSAGASTMQGIRRSTDGTTWTDITPNDMPASHRRIVIGIAPSNPNAVYFLAETPQAGLNGHSLWKYDGQNWENRSANLPAFGQPVGDFDSQGSYDLVIIVKPDDDNTVIIGGTNLYRSTNGFASTAVTTWIGGYNTTNDISLYPNHHPDNHSLMFAPNNSSILFSGHDGGVSKTTNVLATPLVWQYLNNGYLTTQCYTVALDHGTNGSADILSGFQDNGCWGVNSGVSTASWALWFGGDGAFTAFSNGGASKYVSSQNGNTYRLFGSNWTQFARVDPQGGTGYLFINPFVLDPNNSNIMYLGGGNSVWRNSDLTQIPAGSNNPATTNWTGLQNSTVTGQTQVSALAVSTANPTNRLYIGHSAGAVLRVDGANTGDPQGTTITPPGVPQNAFVSGIAVDPTDGSKLLVVYANYSIVSLYYSANAGQTWTNVEGNLAGANGPSCRSATIVPSGGGTTYYLGTSTGLYSTTSLSATTVWVQEGATNIGNVVVNFLDSRSSDGVVVVGTHANGTYSNSGGGGGGQTTNVYSGDANNDAVCDIRDILPIGRFFASTGPPRAGGSTTWGAQTATIWNTPEATYADCDGNGTVDGNDIQGIITNYGRNRTSNDLPPPVDRVKLCYALLAELDKQPVLSSGMKSIRNAVVAYMKRELGITFDYALAQNYPNPFNPSTTIRFTIPEQTARVQIGIHNLAGQLVWSKTMVDLPIGNHEAVWDGMSNTSVPVASGMYIYRITAGSFTASKRMLMIK
ncbi:MAG: hypothetical protein HW412_1850 [Bacteroidetes bacterium]|nr:hypothetical protein [Bacteroidota bacterium]